MVITAPGIKPIGSKRTSIIIRGSALIDAKSRFNSPLIVKAIIVNRKFNPTNASKLKPSALPNPIIIDLF
ncbi:MAG: hypothetical protein ACXABG_05910 [Promethearchaeota archaeon]